MNIEQALELAKEIDTLEDWPGDVEVIECICELRGYVRVPQPIETAPKSLAILGFWRTTAGDPRWSAMQWFGSSWILRDDMDGNDVEPTHWMAIPEPP